MPITLYFMTHAYFALYHALANVLIRKARNVAKPWGPRAQLAAEIFVVFSLSYSTAFMETLTIAHFPYYTHKVRDYWLKGVGRMPVAKRAYSSLPERVPAPLHPPSKIHQPLSPTPFLLRRTKRRCTRSAACSTRFTFSCPFPCFSAWTRTCAGWVGDAGMVHASVVCMPVKQSPLRILRPP